MVAIIFIAAFLAFLVSAVAGGGAGLVLVPLLRLIVPIASVPAALSIGTAASSVSRIAMLYPSIRWDVVRRFVPTALPAAALGAWLLSRFEPAYVELLIACFLLANLPALLMPRRAAARVVKPLAPGRIPLLGAAAGLLSGFTGALGLAFNGAYHRLGLSRQEIVATRATNEVLLHLLKIALYAWFGLLGGPALVAGALVAVAALLASVAIRWLLPLIRESLFRRIGQMSMVAAGVAMFALSSGQIATLHRAWVTLVAPGGEREVQLYWGGARRFAIEAEPEGYLVLERSMAFEDLPSEVRLRALRHVPRRHITLVESVDGPRGRSYEIYYNRTGLHRKMEIGTGRDGRVEMD